MIRKIKNFFTLLSLTPSQDKNILTYEGKTTVDYYRNLQPHLQPAEQQLIKLLTAEMKDFSMLDIGVGAGRTSYFFAPLVKKYVGADYSKSMVEACRELYPSFQFEVQDARNLQYSSGAFDFVFFSFNGIDSISIIDRQKALDEIHRILKPGGYFYFSTHNILGLDKLFKWPISVNPKRWYKTIVLRKVNPAYQTFYTQNFASVLDGAHGYEITNVYTTPDYQLKQLTEAGFNPQKVLDMNGRVYDPDQATALRDLWLYYLCRKAR